MRTLFGSNLVAGRMRWKLFATLAETAGDREVSVAVDAAEPTLRDAFDALLDTVSVPFYAVPGNHDVPKTSDAEANLPLLTFEDEYTPGSLPFHRVRTVQRRLRHPDVDSAGLPGTDRDGLDQTRQLPAGRRMTSSTRS